MSRDSRVAVSEWQWVGEIGYIGIYEGLLKNLKQMHLMVGSSEYLKGLLK